MKTIRGLRYVFTGMSCFGFVMELNIRASLNLGIVAMVNATATYVNHTDSRDCPNPYINASFAHRRKDGEFVWSTNLQATILGSFYYGYIFTQIPGGRLAEIFSGKWVFGIGIFIASFMTILCPVAAKYHVGLLIFFRIIAGAAQGVTLPAMHSMLGRWLPDSERGFLCAIIYCGINMGIASSMTVTGFLCDSDFLGGWPSAFYVIGFVGFIWFILWSIIITESPYHHPCITPGELKYLADHQTIQLRHDHCAAPWKSILRSAPFWANVIAQVGNDFYFQTIITEMPTYLDRVLHVHIVKNGFMTSFPFVLTTVFGCFISWIADTGIKKGWFSLVWVRKTSNTLGSFGKALGLVGIILGKCDTNVIFISYWFAMCVGGFAYSGHQFAHLDISPKFAGTLMGISNSLASCAGFIAPAMVGALTNKNHNLLQWSIAFSITIAFLTISAVIFLVYYSPEVQPWNIPILSPLSNSQDQHETEFDDRTATTTTLENNADSDEDHTS